MINKTKKPTRVGRIPKSIAALYLLSQAPIAEVGAVESKPMTFREVQVGVGLTLGLALTGSLIFYSSIRSRIEKVARLKNSKQFEKMTKHSDKEIRKSGYSLIGSEIDKTQIRPQAILALLKGLREEDEEIQKTVFKSIEELAGRAEELSTKSERRKLFENLLTLIRLVEHNGVHSKLLLVGDWKKPTEAIDSRNRTQIGPMDAIYELQRLLEEAEKQEKILVVPWDTEPENKSDESNKMSK